MYYVELYSVEQSWCLIDFALASIKTSFKVINK